MKTTLIALTAAALASAVAAAPAQAASSVAVSYADLDIHSDAGAAALATRIQASVDQVCARTVDIRDVQGTASCKSQLLSDATAQLSGKGVQLAAR
jgi:UrcA family protein